MSDYKVTISGGHSNTESTPKIERYPPWEILERRVGGQMRFFVAPRHGNPEQYVGRVEKNGDQWEGWFQAAGPVTFYGWCKKRDVYYQTEDEAIAAVRQLVTDGCWYSG